MRIFISFPSEHERAVEPMVLALRDRDHQVFFSHDDLPAGKSYDARVEQAVWNSDLFIFIITPESVQRGRYTLTELAFARRKWKHPKDHVVPIMLVSTDINNVPSYLAAVTIFKPDGNLAAEVAALIGDSHQSIRNKITAYFIFLGIVSGICSSFFFRWNNLLGVIIGPGFLFGAVLATLAYVRGQKNIALLMITIPITTIGWFAAYYSCMSTYDFVRHVYSNYYDGLHMRDVVKNDNFSFHPEIDSIAMMISGLVSGFVGGLSILLVVSVVSKKVMRFMMWFSNTATAAATGCLLLGLINSLGLVDQYGFAIVFAGWQSLNVGVLAYQSTSDASIGRGVYG